MMLTKEDILDALHEIDAEARLAGKTVDLAIYGGAAMGLVFDLRQVTKDVDAVVRGSPDFLRFVAAKIGEARGWPEGWLNDGVKGFLSSNEKLVELDGFDASAEGGLRIYTPTPLYLFAMKCLAMRTGGMEGESSDVSDIEALTRICEIRSVQEALEIVESFYPRQMIQPKVLFGIEEIVGRVLEAEKIFPKVRDKGS